jgi:dipeptidyl-peptidase-4
MIARPMAVLFRTVVPLLVAVVAAAASAQQAGELTLATVLARGPALQSPLPETLWLPGGHDATVVRHAPDGNQTLHRCVDGKVADEVVLDSKTLRAALGEAGEGPARFPALRWLDATTLRVETATSIRHWRLLADGGLADGGPLRTVLQWPAATSDGDVQAIAPDDGGVAVVRDHQLWFHGQDGRIRQLTFDGSRDIVYGGAAHRAEFGIDRGLFWRGDGRYLAFYREDQRSITPYPYQDLGVVPPQAAAGRYPMAGAVHSRVQVGVFDRQDGSVRWLAHDAAEDGYWTNLTWAADGSLCCAVVDRGQSHCQLRRFDPATGQLRGTLLEEHDPVWIEPEHGPHFLADGGFLWWSRRTGHRHLWRYFPDGGEPRQVTKGAFDVQQLLGTAADGSVVWFTASGEDPRQLHLFAARLDGSEVKQLTRERGTHRVTLSPDGQWAHVVWSNLETRPEARLLELATGTAVPLPSPPDPLAGFALPTQRLFQLKAEDDTVLYGHVALPPNLQEGQRCPVLLYVYGGPHVQQVTDQWLGGASLWLQALAAEGYVVCRLDNRGTPNRGAAFEQAVHRRLGVLEVEDQLRAVAWLSQQPFVDAARIGVHGWSYGGYLTLRLLLAAPTTFACGVSGAPVTDWAMYETGYTERYMDGPRENADGYHVSSCLPFVGQLQRPLLLVHGTDDKTVMWSHSLAFVDRCIAAGKQLDYFPYPMQQHGLVGAHRKHFLQLLHDWLGKHLRPHERLVEPKPAATPPPEPPKLDPPKEGNG